MSAKQAFKLPQVRPPSRPEGVMPQLKALWDIVEKLCEATGARVEIQGATRVAGSGSGDILIVIPTDVVPTTPFSILSNGVVLPGTVNGIMPTLGGTALNAATPPSLTLSGSFAVYLQMNFTVNYTSSYLSSYSLGSVQVGTGSLPSDSDSVKYLQINTVTSGKPGTNTMPRSFFCGLADDGVNATTFFHS